MIPGPGLLLVFLGLVILAEHFPPGRVDQNELPNHLIVLDASWTA